MSRNIYFTVQATARCNWNIPISIDGLSCSGDEQISVTIPKGLFNDYIKSPVVATFTVGRTVNYTGQTTIIDSMNANQETLSKCKIKDDVWLLCNRAVFLNGEAALLFLEVPKRVCLFSTDLLKNCSPIGKTLKEKIVPKLVEDYTIPVQILDMAGWTQGKHFTTAINPEEIILKQLKSDR